MRCDAPAFYQRGAALILMMFILGMAALAYTVKSMNAASMQLAQDAKTMVALGQAKEALIAWSVTHKYTPGQMPWPDRREVTPPANYDGQSDCSSVSFDLLNSINEPNFLGQIPSITSTTPCLIYSGVGSRFKDSSGNNLWYAVSRNLVRKYSTPATNPIINPGVINVDILKPIPYDGTATTSAYPWLVVKDKRGVVISDRVAVVIIAPGAPLDGQNRSVAAPPSSAYLDNITVDGVVYSNRDYDQDDEDFIMGDTTTPSFNDRLVFITIDELIVAISRRASYEARNLLNKYNFKNTYFPNAASLSATASYISGYGEKGKLPIDITDSCSCESASNCECSFNPITSVTLERDAGTWDNSLDVGGCSSAVGSPSKKCTCVGAGSCSRFATIFSCNNTGGCSHNLPNSTNNKFIYKVPDYADLLNSTAGCIISSETIQCNDAGTFAIGLKEPMWFKSNLWQDYIYYEWSPTSSLQSDGKTGISSLLIATGAPIVNAPFSFKGSAQSRPSNNIDDYLDSEENINGDFKFEATNKQKTHIYNDQVFIVAP